MVNECAESKQFLARGPQAFRPGQHFSCFWKEISNSLHTWEAFSLHFLMPLGRTGFLVSNLLNFPLKDGFCSETQTKISILRIYAGHAFAPVPKDFIERGLQNISEFSRSRMGFGHFCLMR